MKTQAFNYRIKERCGGFIEYTGYGLIVIEPVKWIMASGVNQCKRLYKKIILNTEDPELTTLQLIQTIKDDMDEGRQMIGQHIGFNTVPKSNGRWGYKYFNEKDFKRLQWFVDWLESQLD